MAEGLAHLRQRFMRTQRSAVAVEFAVIGTLYFLVLLFAVEGGIFYLKVDTLDLATERAARLLIINNYNTAPSSAGAFITAIANDADGPLQAANIAVSVTVAAPVNVNASAGFQSLINASFTPGTFNYIPGSCVVTTNLSVTPNTVAVTGCTGSCKYKTVLGLLDQGYESVNASKVTSLNQVYTCMAGQDVLVQVQYTDSTLTKLVSKYFGPIISTLAFQAEPSVS